MIKEYKITETCLVYQIEVDLWNGVSTVFCISPSLWAPKDAQPLWFMVLSSVNLEQTF